MINIIFQITPYILILIASSVTFYRIIKNPMPIGMSLGVREENYIKKYSLKLSAGNLNYKSVLTVSSTYATSLIFLFLTSIINTIGLFIDKAPLKLDILSLAVIIGICCVSIILYTFILELLKDFIIPKILGKNIYKEKLSEEALIAIKKNKTQ